MHQVKVKVRVQAGRRKNLPSVYLAVLQCRQAEATAAAAEASAVSFFLEVLVAGGSGSSSSF